MEDEAAWEVGSCQKIKTEDDAMYRLHIALPRFFKRILYTFYGKWKRKEGMGKEGHLSPTTKMLGKWKSANGALLCGRCVVISHVLLLKTSRST